MEAMRQGAEVYQKLKAAAKKKYGQSAGNVGDEGGVAPDIGNPEEALDLIAGAIKDAGYEGKMDIAMDVASSEFYKEDAKKYDMDFKNPNSDPSKWLTYEQLADLYKQLASKYPIVSIEDPFAEDDWGSMELLLQEFGLPDCWVSVDRFHLTANTDVSLVMT